MVWLQMAHTLRARQHLRSNLILAALPGLGQRAIILLNCVAGVIMMVEQSLTLVLVMVALFVRMLAQSEEEERRRERLADREETAQVR